MCAANSDGLTAVLVSMWFVNNDGIWEWWWWDVTWTSYRAFALPGILNLPVWRQRCAVDDAILPGRPPGLEYWFATRGVSWSLHYLWYGDMRRGDWVRK